MDSADQHLAAAQLRERAYSLAGRIEDLTQRASVYHHLYAHSGGNHSFPLLAAHGALWASGYFKMGMRFGSLAASVHQFLGDDADELRKSLRAFADDFRDINRRVCVETYFIYHLTAAANLKEISEQIVPVELLEQMNRCHAARIAERKLSDSERRSLFSAFFLWEQETIVGPSITVAFDKFDWPLIKRMALKPKIRFAYFDRRSPLAFRHFADMDERVAMGMAAFDRACEKGWAKVEGAMSDYQIMPESFTENPNSYFQTILDSFSGSKQHALLLPA